MSLTDIQCTCPNCGTEFFTRPAFGEQALAKVQAEISQMNDEQIQARVDALRDWLLRKEKASKRTNVRGCKSTS